MSEPEIPDVFCQVTLILPVYGRPDPYVCGEPAVSPYGLCRHHQAERERLQAPSQRPPNPDQ